jgi:hypothetical protein
MFDNGINNMYNRPISNFGEQSRNNQNINGYNNQYYNNNNNQYNNNNMNSNGNNFNQTMDNIVKNNLKERGIHLKSDLNTSNYNISPIRAQTAEKKKILLDSIQLQMNLTKNTKLQELERKKKEDEKYLQDISNRYPFGR